MKISRSTLNACFRICSSTLYDSFSPSTTRHHKQTNLESKHQTRHLKFTPFGLRYKLRARHTESVKVFLETSDTKHDFEQQVYNVHDSPKISEFQFSSFVVRLDRFTVLPLPIKTWDTYFYWSRLGTWEGTLPQSSQAKPSLPSPLQEPWTKYLGIVTVISWNM